MSLAVRCGTQGVSGAKIKVSLGQQRVPEDQGHDGWVLVRLRVEIDGGREAEKRFSVKAGGQTTEEIVVGQ